jgi:2-oxoisovalerate dehydrogenase E1 component alpha subunit
MRDILQRYPKEYDLDGYQDGAGGLDELLEKKEKK